MRASVGALVVQEGVEVRESETKDTKRYVIGTNVEERNADSNGIYREEEIS